MNWRKEMWLVSVPVLCGIAGFIIGSFFLQYTIPPPAAPYFSLAALSCLDAICGGVRAGVEGKFHRDIFLSGFFINSLLAGLLAYAGDRIGVDLYLAAIVVMGWRVFTNLSLLRRYFLTQSQMTKSVTKEG